MSFKQREKKRKKNAAMTSAQATARATGSSAGKWWLTIAVTTTCCARCAGVLRKGREMVYRARPLEALCKDCAERDTSITPRPSARWERDRLTRKGRKS